MVYLTLCLNNPRAGGWGEMVKDGQSTKKGHWEISPQKLSFTENGLIETDKLNRFYCLFKKIEPFDDFQAHTHKLCVHVCVSVCI